MDHPPTTSTSTNYTHHEIPRDYRESDDYYYQNHSNTAHNGVYYERIEHHNPISSNYQDTYYQDMYASHTAHDDPRYIPHATHSSHGTQSGISNDVYHEHYSTYDPVYEREQYYHSYEHGAPIQNLHDHKDTTYHAHYHYPSSNVIQNPERDLNYPINDQYLREGTQYDNYPPRSHYRLPSRSEYDRNDAPIDNYRDDYRNSNREIYHEDSRRLAYEDHNYQRSREYPDLSPRTESEYQNSRKYERETLDDSRTPNRSRYQYDDYHERDFHRSNNRSPPRNDRNYYSRDSRYNDRYKSNRSNERSDKYYNYNDRYENNWNSKNRNIMDSTNRKLPSKIQKQIKENNEFFSKLENNTGNTFFRNKYKGALLHTHFSGTVKRSTLMSFLFENKTCRYKVNFHNGQLFWLSENCPYTPNVNYKTKFKIEEIIQNAWSSDFGTNFKILGNLFFNLIKNEEFFPHYLDLIMNEMKAQLIDHVELRLKLGSIFRYNSSKKIEYRTMKDELDHLLKAKEKFEENGLSFTIIAQYTKHKNAFYVKKYFMDVMELMKENEKIKDLIKGFDIVGNEKDGNNLTHYRQSIEDVKKTAKDWNLDIFFIYHAGEDIQALDKSLENIEFALETGNYRIGHGVQAIEDETVLKKLKESEMILEFCPLSMKFYGNLGKETLSKFRSSELKYCINSDDTNKIHDTDLDSNIEFLLNNGYTEIEIINSIKISIENSFCSSNLKEKMLKKWEETYGDYLNGTKDFKQVKRNESTPEETSQESPQEISNENNIKKRKREDTDDEFKLKKQAKIDDNNIDIYQENNEENYEENNEVNEN